MQVGSRLVTKLWNVARFSERFLEGYILPQGVPTLAPTDRWILSRLHRLIQRVTELFQNYDYSTAKGETESFFWTILTDNYLEMVKRRLYGDSSANRESARYTLYTVLSVIVKLFAPILPYVTEQIYQGLFAADENRSSIHLAKWPVAQQAMIDDQGELLGEALVEIATAVRRYKTVLSLALNTELPLLHLVTDNNNLASLLQDAEEDIHSVTRVLKVKVSSQIPSNSKVISNSTGVTVALISSEGLL